MSKRNKDLNEMSSIFPHPFILVHDYTSSMAMPVKLSTFSSFWKWRKHDFWCILVHKDPPLQSDTTIKKGLLYVSYSFRDSFKYLRLSIISIVW